LFKEEDRDRVCEVVELEEDKVIKEVPLEAQSMLLKSQPTMNQQLI
jgi:hypothetical protein